MWNVMCAVLIKRFKGLFVFLLAYAVYSKRIIYQYKRKCLHANREVYCYLSHKEIKAKTVDGSVEITIHKLLY